MLALHQGGESVPSISIIYSAFHRNSPFARFIKLDVALAWLNIKFSSMAHMKQLTANFHVTIQKSQKSQGY